MYTYNNNHSLEVFVVFFRFFCRPLLFFSFPGCRLPFFKQMSVFRCGSLGHWNAVCWRFWRRIQTWKIPISKPELPFLSFSGIQPSSRIITVSRLSIVMIHLELFEVFCSGGWFTGEYLRSNRASQPFLQKFRSLGKAYSPCWFLGGYSCTMHLFIFWMYLGSF